MKVGVVVGANSTNNKKDGFAYYSSSKVSSVFHMATAVALAVAVLSGILFHARVNLSVICVSHDVAVVLVAVVSGWIPLKFLKGQLVSFLHVVSIECLVGFLQ